MSIPSSPAQVNGNTATITDVAATGAFPDYVHRYDALHIDWELSVDGGSTWEDVGTTENEVFVTLTSPQCEQNWRTVLYVATKNGGATSYDTAAANAWISFAGRDIRRWNEVTRAYDEPLFYYGPIPPLPPEEIDTASLLRTRNGECRAWVYLLKDTFRANGVGYNYRHQVNPPSGVSAFYVKNVEATSESFPGETWNYVYNDLNSDGVLGIAGQGVSTPSQKLFEVHHIMSRGSTYYDPSYGTCFVAADKASAERAFTTLSLDFWQQLGADRFRHVLSTPEVFVEFVSVAW
jgi:hypothetical protein